MRAVMLVAVLGLVGCSPQAPDGAAAPPPADAPAAPVVTPEMAKKIGTTDFSGPMIARGNEPFWAVKMEGTKFTLMTPGQPDKIFEAPGAMIRPGRGEWQAKSDGQTMTVTLYVSDCNDGMSDIHYPMVAEVSLPSGAGFESTAHYRGCAGKMSDLAKEPAR